MSTIAEKEKSRQTRSERELEKLGEGTSTAAKPAATVAKVKAGERPGVGTDNTRENAKRLKAALLARIAAARKTGNDAFAARLEAQLAKMNKAK